MTGRILLSTLLVLLAVLPAASPAGTIATKYGGHDLTLAGERSVWIAMDAPRWWAIEVGEADGRVRTLRSGALGMCAPLPRIAASSTRVAVLVRTQREEPSGGCVTERIEVLAGPADGPLALVERFVAVEGGSDAGPSAITLEGDRLAVLRSGSGSFEIALYDLAAGSPPTALRPGLNLHAESQVELAGDLVAVALDPSMFQSRGVLVLDAATGDVVRRVDAGALSRAGQFALAPDGRVLLSAEIDYVTDALYVSTPQEPSPQAVPLTLCGTDFGFDGGDRVLVCRADARDLAVVDLRGTLHDVISHGMGMTTLDFDGRRLAWMPEWEVVRNEAYPFSAPDPPPVAPVPVGGGPGGQRALSSATRQAAAPHLAAAGGRAMSLWLSDDTVLGRPLDRAGAPTGAVRAVSRPGLRVAQPVAAGGARRHWLAAWASADDGVATVSVRVRGLDARGRPAGRERVLPSAAGATADHGPQVVRARGGYLVAWQSQRSGGSGRLLAARLDSSGRVLGAPRTVSVIGDGGRVLGSSLVRTADGPLLVWSQDDSAGRQAVFVQRLSLSGKRRGARRRLSAAGAPPADGVISAHHAASGRTLVAWRQGEAPSGGDVVSVVLSRSGRPLGKPGPLAGVEPRERLAAAADASGFAVAGVAGGRDVHVVATGTDGRAQGKPVRVSAEPGSLPALASPGGDSLLAAWQGTTRPRIWVRALRVR